jgi:hypothetical protein
MSGKLDECIKLLQILLEMMPKDEACKALEEFIALLLRERDVP